MRVSVYLAEAVALCVCQWLGVGKKVMLLFIGISLFHVLGMSSKASHALTNNNKEQKQLSVLEYWEASTDYGKTNANKILSN